MTAGEARRGPEGVQRPGHGAERRGGELSKALVFIRKRTFSPRKGAEKRKKPDFQNHRPIKLWIMTRIRLISHFIAHIHSENRQKTTESKLCTGFI